MSHFYNMAVGASLAILLAMILGLLFVGAWRQLTRQFSRCGLAVFLICAGIATVEAQKTLYVDINKSPESSDFRTIQEAFDFLDGKSADDVDIIVMPGVYPPVDLTHFHFIGKTILTPYFDVDSSIGPWSVVIDGGGVTNAITAGRIGEVLPREWHGLVFSNAVCGADGGGYCRCVAVDCKVGFKNSFMSQCLSYGNTVCGAQNCNMRSCLIANNGGDVQSDISTGAQACWMEGTVVWGNVKNGESSNWSDSSHAEYCCSAPMLPGEGNVCADPMFVDAANGDFHLRMGSPCINTYASRYPMFYEYEQPYPYDFDGNPRVQRGLPDIGPYEFQPTNETQTITAPVPVEFAWINERCPELLASVGGDYDKAVLLKSANPIDISQPEPQRSYYSIWESYVADLDPTDSNATFRATITTANGVPCVKGDPESPNRKYTILGKQTLTDEVWSASCPAPQFFKVKVELK